MNLTEYKPLTYQIPHPTPTLLNASVFFPLYDRDMLEDHIVENTKFETPLTSHHKFGSVYEKETNTISIWYCR